ncbi:hypothetical protein D5R93_10535 [Actinomyces lilanjuaniae]|uniref:Uncharacterized protein n=1 Tax=Actinomyces lilanjuaniae TaxID=2321394 RepID=A0ABM6Z5S0_9ACTO|nr:hypothetical protein D5R93_10535 [Actinomyces lilanjuaniae]
MGAKHAGSYLSHGCRHCDSLAGAYFLNETITEAFTANLINSLPVIIELVRPSIEYMLLNAERDNLHWHD